MFQLFQISKLWIYVSTELIISQGKGIGQGWRGSIEWRLSFEGKVPEKLLNRRSSSTSEDMLKMVGGIEPESWFSPSISNLRRDSCNRESGMGPTRLLFRTSCQCVEQCVANSRFFLQLASDHIPSQLTISLSNKTVFCSLLRLIVNWEGMWSDANWGKKREFAIHFVNWEGLTR